MLCCFQPRNTTSPPTSNARPLAAETGSISGAAVVAGAVPKIVNAPPAFKGETIAPPNGSAVNDPPANAEAPVSARSMVGPQHTPNNAAAGAEFAKLNSNWFPAITRPVG